MKAKKLVEIAAQHSQRDPNADYCKNEAEARIQEMKEAKDMITKAWKEEAAKYWATKSLMHSIGIWEMKRLYNINV